MKGERQNRTEVFNYIFNHYYKGDINKASKDTGILAAHLRAWQAGDKVPQNRTIEYLFQLQLVPEFRVIVEFGEIDTSDYKTIWGQLDKLLNEHDDSPGIYAFYDSMANLLYIGKATKLRAECKQALDQPLGPKILASMPKNVKSRPQKRCEVVRYISAYDVGQSPWMDYPKHVESLILRISKPLLNQNIGKLEQAYSSPPES